MGIGTSAILLGECFDARSLRGIAVARFAELARAGRMAGRCALGYAAAHINLGNVLFQKGQLDEAITQFQKALEINPEAFQRRRINLFRGESFALQPAVEVAKHAQLRLA